MRAFMRSHGRIPKHMQDKPRLRAGLQLYYRAFFELATCRSYGMSEGPIPWTSILSWANEHDLIGPTRTGLFFLISRMDHAYLKHQSKKT